MQLGLSVAVLEEDSEVGTPEHCGGLVSIGGIQNLGIIPSSKAIENKIRYAKIFSPSKCFELNAEKQKVIVLDRRVFDKQIAFQAQKMGAEIRVKCSMLSILEGKKLLIIIIISNPTMVAIIAIIIPLKHLKDF